MLGLDAKPEKVSADHREKYPPFISLSGPSSPEVGSKGIINKGPLWVANRKNSIYNNI